MKVKGYYVRNIPQRRSVVMMEHGWANGYLVFSPDHPVYGKDYDYFNMTFDIKVHGGWTYSGMLNKSFKDTLEQVDEGQDFLLDENWVVGFDTKHYGDNLKTWPKEKVLEHIRELEDYFSRVEYFI